MHFIKLRLYDMKRKPFLLVPTFLLLSVFCMSQLLPVLPGEPARPSFAKTGIKKRISELMAVKATEGKPIDLESIKSLKFSLKKFANLTKPAVGNAGAAQRE